MHRFFLIPIFLSFSLFSQENNQIDLRKIAEQNAEEIAKSLPNKINEIPANDFSLDNDDLICAG